VGFWGGLLVFFSTFGAGGFSL